MNTMKKAISLILALAMVCCMAAVAFAEEGGMGGSVPVTPTGLGNAQISNYKITDLAGNEITKEIQPGQHFNLYLYMYETALVDNKIDYVTYGNIIAKANSTAFTCANKAEVNPWWDEQSPIQQYFLLFRDVTFNGGSDTFDFTLSYDGCPAARIQNISTTKMAQFGGSSAHTPSLIVREANYGSQVIAGQEFTLGLTLFSSIGDESLTDVIVSLNLPENVFLVSSKQSVCIPKLEPRSTATASFVLRTGANIATDVINIGVNMNATGTTSYSSVGGTGSVTIPISQPERFEITGIDIPDTMFLGEEQYLTINYVNKGAKDIRNLSASINGENLANPGQSQYLGNVPSGTEKSAEFSLMANDLGVISGTVVLTYENSRGDEMTLTKDYSINVEEMPVWDGPWGYDEPVFEEPAPAGPPVWLYLLIAAAAIIAAVVIFKVIKKKKAAKAEAAELALDEPEIQDSYQPIPPASRRK